MKCEQFKSLLMREPGTNDPDFHQHRQQCESCEKDYQQAMQFEKQLFQAFQTELPVAKSRQILKQAQQRSRRRRKRSFIRYAVAASLVASLSMGLYLLQLKYLYSLPEFVLAHIEHERDQLGNHLQVSTQRLVKLTTEFDDAYLQTLQQKITYIQKCWLRTGNGLHLILQGQVGPVTLLLMPDENAGSVIPVTSAEFSGKIYPLERGSFALVGEYGEPLEMLAESLRMAMLKQNT